MKLEIRLEQQQTAQIKFILHLIMNVANATQEIATH